MEGQQQQQTPRSSSSCTERKRKRQKSKGHQSQQSQSPQAHYRSSNNNKVTHSSLWNPNQYTFDADYNDHFETPLQAYIDLLPLLDAIQPDRTQHVLYDPYYCNGQTKRQLVQSLGFSNDNVIHEPGRDFYHDIRHNNLPSHYHTFVTNPPYSDEHKERCLQYCLSSNSANVGKVFCVLLPCYVAAKQYYRKLMAVDTNNCDNDDDKHNNNNSTTETKTETGIVKMMYVVPTSSKEHQYHYTHPDGTGHDTPPFDSMWYVGMVVVDDTDTDDNSTSSATDHNNNNTTTSAKRATQTWEAMLQAARQHYNSNSSSDNNNNSNRDKRKRCTVYTSYQQLMDAKIITVDNPRPNPKQRRKQRKRHEHEHQPLPKKQSSSSSSIFTTTKMPKPTATPTTTTTATSNNGDSSSKNSRNGSSKYRDGVTGQRTKRRF